MSKCLEVLVEMHKEFGGGLYTQTSGKSGVYRLIMQQRVAITFLKRIQPFVKVKRDQVALALAFQELRDSRGSHRQRLSEEEIILYDTIKATMRELNHKHGRALLEKLGEFKEGPTHTVKMAVEDNPEPSSMNGIEVVEKVQRLTVDEPTNTTDTSAQPERDEIVRHLPVMGGVEDKEPLCN